MAASAAAVAAPVSAVKEEPSVAAAAPQNKNRVMLVCGSRTWKDKEKLETTLDSYLKDHPAEQWTIVHGGCKSGADDMVDQYARARGIPVWVFQADWDTYKKAAGPKRNRNMVHGSRPHVAFAFRAPGKSAGTDNCLWYLRKYKERAFSTLRSLFVVYESTSSIILR